MKANAKHSRRRLAVIAVISCATVALALAGFAAIMSLHRKPVIAFYRVPDTVAAEIVRLASNPATGIGGGMRAITLPEDRPLSEQGKTLARCALLFAQDGAAAESVASTIAGLIGARALMPSSIRKIAVRNDARYGMPLLLDHFELAYSLGFAAKSGISWKSSLDEILRSATASKGKAHWPIVCAGADDANLIMLASALAEARFGPDERERIAERMRAGDGFKTLLDSTKLGPTLRELALWRESGIIHPEWFRMADDDVTAFMESGNCDLAFMSLSSHRRVPLKVIERYSSMPFPSANGGKRALLAPAIVCVVPRGASADRAALDFLDRLARDPAQGSLSRATGLAPVNASAETRDVQAYDVRLWVAGCERPVADLASESLGDPAKTAAFAREIRQFVESNGIGF